MQSVKFQTWLKQAWTITKIELKRAFFSKRAFWVYGLAFFPAVIFFAHSIETKFQRMSLSSAGAISPALMDSIRTGESIEDVLQRLGTPSSDSQRISRIPNEGDSPGITMQAVRRIVYFDGQREARLDFADGKLVSRHINTLLDFEEDRQVFAGVFQYFYLRLAIFFGCLGIFMNLFRGEMLDKTLHFWFLVPARREVLLAGKYGAGLIASTVIFAGAAFLCFALMLWPHSGPAAQAYWQSAGMGHAFWYVVASVFACVGYGSVFLATGLLLRNPIVPAAILLGWESINGFLPTILQKLSVLHYLQSLCPVPPPMDQDMPAFLQLLLVPASPASRTGAILGLLAVTVLVLLIARFAILRMQVSYSNE